MGDVAGLFQVSAVLIVVGVGAFFITRRRSRAGWIPVLVATVCALLAMGALFPKECFGTLAGVPPGGPDPNPAQCSTYLITSPSWASMAGGHPDTDEQTDTVALVARRLHLAGAGAALIILITGLMLGRLFREASSRRMSQA